MTRPYFIVEKWNVLTSARAPKRAHLRMQFVFLALILQIGRCHNTCNILPPINSLRLSLSLSIRRPRLDMCLLAPLPSSPTQVPRAIKMVVTTPESACSVRRLRRPWWRHICVRGRLNSGSSVSNNCRTLFTEVSIFEPFTRDNTQWAIKEISAAET